MLLPPDLHSIYEPPPTDSKAYWLADNLNIQLLLDGEELAELLQSWRETPLRQLYRPLQLLYNGMIDDLELDVDWEVDEVVEQLGETYTSVTLDGPVNNAESNSLYPTVFTCLVRQQTSLLQQIGNACAILEHHPIGTDGLVGPHQLRTLIIAWDVYQRMDDIGYGGADGSWNRHRQLIGQVIRFPSLVQAPNIAFPFAYACSGSHSGLLRLPDGFIDVLGGALQYCVEHGPQPLATDCQALLLGQ